MPRVGEFVLSPHPLLYFAVCVAFALLRATGHSKTPLWDRTKRLKRVDERDCGKNENNESRRAKGYRLDGYLICVVRLSYLSELHVVLESCFLPIGRVLFVCRFVVVRSNDERYTRSKVTRPRVRFTVHADRVT